MKIVLEAGASKIVTFLPLEPGALPNFARGPEAPKPVGLHDCTRYQTAWFSHDREKIAGKLISLVDGP